ncbi:M48 family metallopeptidase [Photobacterium nomapromontoriensis]|uniref:M48 family metallopeptidase n=1 Tax=Photobacterium nomapromontoriensis TaxID=2910237 RepID=UPI003D10AA5E
MIQGFCHPPRRSEKQPASVTVLSDGQIQLVTEQGQQTLPLIAITISEPLGSLPIKLVFPCGLQFIPDDSMQLERALRARKWAWLHRTERSWALILGSLLATALLCVMFITHGIPLVTKGIVTVMPSQVSVAVGDHVLKVLDKHMLEPSELSVARQAEIKHRFNDMTVRLAPLPVAPKLLFRQWGDGPNAIALSNGSIIVFDSLVELAEQPAQLDSILLHELGHIDHQHIMKSLVRSTLWSVSVAVIIGETSGLIDVLSGAGVFLVTQGYSRTAEQEADTYAAKWMRHLYGTVTPMQQMFERLQGFVGEGRELPQWLSTHPGLDERIDALK